MQSCRSLLKDRGICVIIPTFNNASTIATVVADAKNYCDRVIVVNDGSTDNTLSILQSIANIEIITYEKNAGKGHALRAGFRIARSLGYSYAITMDADGQHYAKDIPAFLEANRKHPYSLIVGSRQQVTGSSQQAAKSNFANKFANFWFYIQTGQRGIDTQSGYRLYPLKRLHGLRLLTSRYEAELELLVFSSWHGTEIHSIPIDVYYPPREQRVSHFRPACDFGRISLLNTVLCFLAIVYGLPCRITRFLDKIVRTAYTALTFVFCSTFIITPLLWLYIHIGKMNDKKRKHTHSIIQHISRFIMLRNIIPGTRFSQTKHPDVDFDKPKIIICNHQSPFDLTCILQFSPKIVFVTKDWVINNPFYGYIIRTAEYLQASKGLDELLPRMKDLVDRGYNIAIFPEGTRSKDCQINRFHQGAFYLAYKLGLDIQPMVIYGAGRVFAKYGRIVKRGAMRIEVDKPISHDQLKQVGDFMAQAKHMRNYYINRYNEIANRIERG